MPKRKNRLTSIDWHICKYLELKKWVWIMFFTGSQPSSEGMVKLTLYLWGSLGAHLP